MPGDYGVDKALFAKRFTMGVQAIQHSISVQDKSVAEIELDCTLGKRRDSSQANNRPALPQLDHLTALTQQQRRRMRCTTIAQSSTSTVQHEVGQGKIFAKAFERIFLVECA